MGEFGARRELKAQRQQRYSRQVESDFLSVMRLRVALDFPLVVSGEEQRAELWRRLREQVGLLIDATPEGGGGGTTAVCPPNDEIQDAVLTLPILHNHRQQGATDDAMSDISVLLRSASPFLNKVSDHLSPSYFSLHTSPYRPPKRGPLPKIRVGIVSGSFCAHAVGRVTLPLISSLPRETFRVHIFALPTVRDSWASAISWSADAYVPLPEGPR
jgi:hypothetical protein